ncbi:MAG: hypothetical protein COA43_01130 [Robiginitomaculum sp.]|nr:MAG: hypothetical protein COA43_01130 [Robiginitomaculum sp.]
MVGKILQDTYPVPSAPQAYDIVQARFPYNEEPYKPGPKRRPCLVLAVQANVDNSGTHYATVQVAYGTSQAQPNRPPWEYFHVHNYTALDRSGLCRDTYFIVTRVQWLLWCEDYFPVVKELETPILGHLPHNHILALKNLKDVRDSMRTQGIL